MRESSIGRGERHHVAERVRRLLDGDAPDAADSADPADAGVHAARGVSRYRLDPGRRGAAAVAVAVAVAGVLTAIWVFSSRPTAMPVTGPGAGATGTALAGSALAGSASTAPIARTGRTTPAGAAGSAGNASGGAVTPSAASRRPSASPRLVVDVAGKVRHPGVYRLPSGARVDDAIRAAGGALAGVNLVSLNLAAKLVDGEQVVVGVTRPKGGSYVTGASPPAAGGAQPGSTGAVGASGTPGRAARINLNTATLAQLETLPGIGPALGQRILDWRAAHGRFSSVDQLNDVSGIGDVRMSQLRSLVTV